ncbi:MAG: hypothetical protein HKM89_11085 [Gemmatimonadales bacterium]|nr:hypothetical protein [Gemmatimonadales bacterium]
MCPRGPTCWERKSPGGRSTGKSWSRPGSSPGSCSSRRPGARSCHRELTLFIELTDLLRCPEDHVEQFLVLLPDTIVERSVQAGSLGCPVCGKTYPITDGIARLGAVPPLSESDTVLTAESVEALVGLSGPGGYLALVGVGGALCRNLAEQAEGVHIVGVNPPSDRRAVPMVSLLEAARIPLKTRSVRGVVLAPGYAFSSVWLEDAKRVLLPGLRIVGEGPVPAIDGLEVIASAGGVWVGMPT